MAEEASISRICRAKSELRQIDLALESFILDHNRYPNALEDLVARPSDLKWWPDGGYLAYVPNDPWGRPYNYDRRTANSYRLRTLGRDGVVGGLLEDQDIESNVVFRH
ncbi:MAG: type II secretion system protein GspG [Planctomycetes bacterium]|nr:type II secretion system protein GspG [Planctomycetota bacterium]